MNAIVVVCARNIDLVLTDGDPVGVYPGVRVFDQCSPGVGTVSKRYPTFAKQQKIIGPAFAESAFGFCGQCKDTYPNSGCGT